MEEMPSIASQKEAHKKVEVLCTFYNWDMNPWRPYDVLPHQTELPSIRFGQIFHTKIVEERVLRPV